MKYVVATQRNLTRLQVLTMRKRYLAAVVAVACLVSVYVLSVNEQQWGFPVPTWAQRSKNATRQHVSPWASPPNPTLPETSGNFDRLEYR